MSERFPGLVYRDDSAVAIEHGDVRGQGIQGRAQQRLCVVARSLSLMCRTPLHGPDLQSTAGPSQMARGHL